MEAEFSTDNSVVKYGFNISVEFIYLAPSDSPPNSLIPNCNPQTSAGVSLFLWLFGDQLELLPTI